MTHDEVRRFLGNNPGASFLEIMQGTGDDDILGGTDFFRNNEDEFDVSFAGKVFDTARQFENAISGTGIQIDPQVAAQRGLDQYMAGGNFEVDTDIDDFDDAVSAVGPSNVFFRPQGFQFSTPEAQPTSNNASSIPGGKILIGAAIIGVIIFFTR